MIDYFKKNFFCCFIKSKNNNDSNQTFSKNKFKNLVNSVISLNKNNKNKENICRICNKEFQNEEKICHCLVKDELHPNSKEVQLKIYDKYIHNNNMIHEAIHIDKNHDKLNYLVNNIYDIVEKSSLNEDLTPKRLEKVKENLVNEICIHIEDYINKEV